MWKKNPPRQPVDPRALALNRTAKTDSLDEQMGFPRFYFGPPKLGWLTNFQMCSFEVEVSGEKVLKSGIDLYFIDDEGGYFKSRIQYDPYFFVQTSCRQQEFIEYLEKTYPEVKATQILEKEDLKIANHLVGKKVTLIQVWFDNMSELYTVRRSLRDTYLANKKRHDFGVEDNSIPISECLVNVREDDVPYDVRASIDLEFRVAKWYKVIPPSRGEGSVSLELFDRDVFADAVVMAYDIETTKQPLKFPDSAIDMVMMISYMIDGEGFLIINREVVGGDIEDFEYTPKPDYKGEFTVFNEVNERDLLMRFFSHIQEVKPTVIATFNGDFFDWPFVRDRARAHNIDMYDEIGFKGEQSKTDTIFQSAHCAHMDVYNWVQRDSYLPAGSQNLKKVTSAKLKYNPIEVEPEKMVKMAMEEPQKMAEYSVSDAVATYYLYMTYVHPFIYALSSILPVKPDEVLRKGTGSLCEMLLMVQAYKGNIVFPHKHVDPAQRFYSGHLIESETYTGGHVDAVESGVFRSDIKNKFKLDKPTLDLVLDQLDDALKFTIETELGKKFDECVNFKEVRDELRQALQSLQTNPEFEEFPKVYHVDVASMYPNIMTSNRLQPDSIKTESDCARCDLNYVGKTCDRRLPWKWRVTYYTAGRSENNMVSEQAKKEYEQGYLRKAPNHSVPFEDLDENRKAEMFKKALLSYQKSKKTEEIEREAIICQKENPFYVGTVIEFKNRRMAFKKKQKVAAKSAAAASSAAEREEFKKLVVLNDSMQLAHKCILNSFYGYVMRKGSRWYSMEMAGVTCLTGATIIQLAQDMVEKLGRPLELDTDGIWCIMPQTFPGLFTFKFEDGAKIPLEYPCVMLNYLVHQKFTNHQYHDLVDPEKHIWEQKSENSIFFEVDGPYKAMILPAADTEGDSLKKRYAVFDENDKMTEIKGFEIKRRGELPLIRHFQEEVFPAFMHGGDLKGCYAAVGKVADRWLDFLDTKGVGFEDHDIFSQLSQNRSLSKHISEYGAQKNVTLTAARRLADLLGKELLEGRSLNCEFIISKEPVNKEVTSRAIPVKIFDAPISLKQKFLSQWLERRNNTSASYDIRDIIDWGHYRGTLIKNILKIIVIPAMKQSLPNPVSRVIPPKWVIKQIEERKGLQTKIGFNVIEKPKPLSRDIENLPTELGGTLSPHELNSNLPRRAVVKRKLGSKDHDQSQIIDEPVAIGNIEKDYAAWLKGMKQVWKKQKEQRANHVKLFGPTFQRHRGVGSMLQKQAEQIWKNNGGTWHILRVSAGPDPGKVRAFVEVNSKVQSIIINVPKIVYVLVREGHELPDLPYDIAVEQSRATMPSGMISKNLYQLTMSDSTFQSESVKASGFLKSRSVEQLFEAKISATDRVLIELGGACTVASQSQIGVIGKGLESGFDIKTLKASSIPLDVDPLLNKDFVFIHHFLVGKQQIVLIYSSWRASIDIIEFDSGRGASEDHSAMVKSAYSFRNNVSSSAEQPYFTYHSEIDVSYCKRFNNQTQYWSNVNKCVSDLCSLRPTTAVCVVQSDTSLESFSKYVRLLGDMPCIDLGKVSELQLPAVGWHKEAFKRSVKQFFATQEILNSLHSIANSCELPLGNTPAQEDLRSVIDFVYARKLKLSNHILWWQEPQLDDYMRVNAFQNDSLFKASEIREGIPILEFGGSSKKAFSNVCLDLSLENLVVNTILVSADKDSIEDGFDPTDPSINNDLFSPPAWEVLVQMLEGWWKSALADDEIADRFIQQTPGWLNSSTALLWSPLLNHQVKNLSASALNKLVLGLKRKGYQVIHCSDRGRIIINTAKSDSHNVANYNNLIVKEIRGDNGPFSYLDIRINTTWSNLIWLDENNYAGFTLSHNGDLESVSNWQIADKLPVMLKDEFDEWVERFLALVEVSKTEETISLDSIAKELSNRVKQLYVRYTESLAKPYITEFQPPESVCPWDVEENPLLSFVKCVLVILSLSGEIAQITELRRSLLRKLKVGDFDKRGSIVLLPQKLYVRDIVCEFCMSYADIDVCHPTSNRFSFKCHTCGHELDRLFLEGKLVHMLIELVALYQTQDFVCTKCGKVKPNSMVSYCPCSGKYKNSLDLAQVSRRVELFKRVGAYYNLSFLNDALTQYS